MDRTMARVVVVLGIIAATLAGVASAAGVLLRGDLATEEFVTVRGEVVEVVTEGVYRYNSEAIVAEGIGWDLVTLLLIVPATFIALGLLWRGSLRAALVSAGFLAYFVYQSAEYAVFWAYGPLYPLYVAELALSVTALALLVYELDLDGLAARVDERFPRRAVTGYSLFVVLILAGLWLPVIGTTLGGVVTDELEGATTLVVPAFDLGLLVPLAILTAIAVWRRLPVGYLLGLLVLVKGASMALAIAAMLIVEWQVSGELLAPPLVVFGLVALASVLIGMRALQSVDEPGPRSPGVRPAEVAA